jgi:cysteinyl-tRNA synthetase
MDTGDFRKENVRGALEFLDKFDAVFDVIRPSEKEGDLSDEKVEALIAQRAAAKRSRDFALADQVRQQLLDQGIVLEDTKSGVRWKRK